MSQSRSVSQEPTAIETGQFDVTVITVRAGKERESQASGEFATAVREALSARLAPEAVHQVLGRVLARRPPAGHAATHEGDIESADRRLRVYVRPTGITDPPCRTYRLLGLFVPKQGDTTPDFLTEGTRS